MNILLTGTSRGLGLATCEKLLERGDTIYAVSRTKSDDIIKLEQKFSRNLLFKAADLSEPEIARSKIFAPDFISASVRLDGFVSNAASAYDDIATNMNLARLENMFQTNVFSPMILTKYFLRHSLLHSNGGSIVYISSVSAHTGYKGLSMYAASKGALEAFSKNIAREWGIKSVRSNVVSPGFMSTQMSAKLTVQQREKIYARTSLKAETSADSVAETVAFLLSEKAKSITGQTICVDAGTI